MADRARVAIRFGSALALLGLLAAAQPALAERGGQRWEGAGDVGAGFGRDRRAERMERREERRERWQQMSPDEREQAQQERRRMRQMSPEERQRLRRDILEANRDLGDRGRR